MNAKEINKYLSYNGETGDLRWKISKGTAICGDIVKTKNSHGYIVLKLNGEFLLAHRVAWFITHQEIPDQIDHINGKRDDNRIVNLRNVSHLENGRNQGINKRNTSGFSGVYWEDDRKSWGVRISSGGKRLRIGRYSTLIGAVSARIRAMKDFNYHTNHGQHR